MFHNTYPLILYEKNTDCLSQFQRRLYFISIFQTTATSYSAGEIPQIYLRNELSAAYKFFCIMFVYIPKFTAWTLLMTFNKIRLIRKHVNSA